MKLLLRLAILVLGTVFLNPTLLHSQGLDFDGSDDYLTLNSVANDMQGQTNFTIECWVKIDSIYQSSQGGIIGVHTSTGGNVFILLAGGGGGNNQISVYDGGGTAAYEITGGKVADFGWHHVAYVRSGTQGVLFLDGISQGIHTPNYVFNATDRWSMGQEWDGNSTSDHLNGVMDEVRIWKAVRTATQIQDDMNRELCLYPSSLVAYYKMNQGTAYGVNLDEDTVVDVSIYNNLAFPENFALAGFKSNFGEDAGAGSHSTQVLDVCKRFQSPSGKYMWTVSGTYKDTLQNSDGCDSVVTFVLTVNNTNSLLTQNGDTLTAVQTGAIYQWLDCSDNFAPIAGANSQSFVPTHTGSYAVMVVQNNCPDTSACYQYSGLEQAPLKTRFRCFPNPFESGIYLELEQGNDGLVVISDLSGKEVFRQPIKSGTTSELLLDLPAGVYLLQLISGDDRYTERLMKR